MSLSKFALGYRDFYSDAGIIECIRYSKHFNSESETPSRASILLIFQTASQQTWLVATPLRLYVILDDIGKERPKVIRSIPKRRLFDKDYELILEITTQQRLRNYSEGVGGLKLGTYRSLLFSHKLFPESPPDEGVRTLLKEQMT
jgi:hypothetical protein